MKNQSLLVGDPNFMPAIAEEGDELYSNGIFVFNITKIQRHLKESGNEFKLECISVQDYHSSWTKLNQNHIDAVDISIPIILAEISPGQYNVIDGNHRIEKAFRNDIDCIWAYKLTVKQHLPFLTSVRAYITYIDYWNSKVEQLSC